ncbi:hypothetical protein L211DRAFT_261166 [Terfezia boudieri ATCC MYA-4762]|uniref:Secreted protein n=1 Tax=Terfezia boudieri ATCC MYA-4762 TaxID=1051890 RepID=A0A3N4M5N4_9PEZI|nr:hypothetical protein L211DRAFT_261166 [Terfezia boudieri ATCC MYA-4762]
MRSLLCLRIWMVPAILSDRDLHPMRSCPHKSFRCLHVDDHGGHLLPWSILLPQSHDSHFYVLFSSSVHCLITGLQRSGPACIITACAHNSSSVNSGIFPSLTSYSCSGAIR